MESSIWKMKMSVYDDICEGERRYGMKVRRENRSIIYTLSDDKRANLSASARLNDYGQCARTTPEVSAWSTALRKKNNMRTDSRCITDVHVNDLADRCCTCTQD